MEKESASMKRSEEEKSLEIWLNQHTEKLQKKAIEIAKRKGHKYVTSDDVREAIDECDLDG